jgi:hypothetical protein
MATPLVSAQQPWACPHCCQKRLFLSLPFSVPEQGSPSAEEGWKKLLSFRIHFLFGCRDAGDAGDKAELQEEGNSCWLHKASP